MILLVQLLQQGLCSGVVSGCTFMAVGPSFRENVWLDSAAMIDEAPTFAALLGVPLPAADGKILQELLR